MAYSTDVERAKALALRAHAGQVDRAGEPYAGHPARVAARVRTDEARVVAWLHDVVEDTDVTLAEIEAESDADPNFLPPLTPEVVFMALLPLGLALLIYFGLLRLLRRRKRHGGKGPEITQRYLR